MRRRVAKLVRVSGAFLALGAAMNVAVAWGCALWIDPHRATAEEGGVGFGRSGWVVTMHRRAGAMSIERLWHEMDGPPILTKSWHDHMNQAAQNSIEDKLPRWSAAWSDFEVERPWYWQEEARGWPCLAFRCAMDGVSYEYKVGNYMLQPNQRVENDKLYSRDAQGVDHWQRDLAPGDCVKGGYLIGTIGNPLHPQPRVLPLRPIWINFAANTIFYAAILWPLFAAPGAARRRRRINRGLCPHCAYPAGSSDACTECGREIRIKARPRNPQTRLEP